MSVTLAACLVLVVLQAGCAAHAPVGAAAPTGGVDRDGVLTQSGLVEIVDDGCFSDGECSVTVDGLKVVTLRGWSRETWGLREPELHVGDAVDVRCRKVDGGCTLEGDAGLYVRRAR